MDREVTNQIKQQLQQRRHEPIPVVGNIVSGRWLVWVSERVRCTEETG